jgi:hypothetical protein
MGLRARVCANGVRPCGCPRGHKSLARRDVVSHWLVGSPIKDIERDLVLEALAKTDGNRTASAPAWVQWCRSVLAVRVHWLKMDAQKTYVLWLNRNTQEQAFSGRGARARPVAGHLSAEVRAVLANTEPPMRTTRN